MLSPHDARTPLVPAALVVLAWGTPAFCEPRLQASTAFEEVPSSLDLTILLDGEPATLRMARASLRASEHHTLADAGDGEPIVVDAAPPRTYRGVVDGRPGSRVGGWFSPTGLEAVVVTDDGVWMVEPDANDGHSAREFLGLPPSKASCGVSDQAPGAPRETGARAQMKSTSYALATIAYDVDSVYMALHGGSVASAQASIEGEIAMASAIFEFYVGIQFSTTAAVFRTASSDPYVTTYGLDDTDVAWDWVAAFQDQWTTSMPEISLARDFAYLFSGYPTFANVEGMAYQIGSVCVSDEHYAAGARPASQEARIYLFCHEVAHLFDAVHCGFFGTNCGIMFPNVLGGEGMFFEPKSITDMQAYVNSVSCLTAVAQGPAPTLTSVSPSEVQALDGGRLTLTGDNLLSSVLVSVSPVAADPFDLYDFVVIDDETVELLAPRATSLGTQSVSVEGPGGTSATATFDYVETSPPKIVTDKYPKTTKTAIWSYGGLVGKTGQVLLAFDPTTTTVSGFDVLANGSVADSVTFVDPGIATFSRYVPPALLHSTLYLQVLVSDGSGLLEVSEIVALPITI